MGWEREAIWGYANNELSEIATQRGVQAHHSLGTEQGRPIRMPRTADYTIQGFLYQFNKTAVEILKAQDDDTITVEGIVEDIEIASPTSLTAIQCKYHEASTSYVPSAVYKPLLQMLKHFSDHSAEPIRYVLFAHFSGVDTPPPACGEGGLCRRFSIQRQGPSEVH